MKDRSLIDQITPTFIALSPIAIHNSLSARKTDEVWVLPEFGPRGGAQCQWDKLNCNHMVIIASQDRFCRLDQDFRTFSLKVQAKMIHNIHSMIHHVIHWTGTDPAMAQPHTDKGRYDENILDYLPEELIEQPDNSLYCLSSFVAATEASMQFSAVLPMGGSAITSTIQPVPCSDSNSNRNDITSITNMTSIWNEGLVNEVRL